MLTDRSMGGFEYDSGPDGALSARVGAGGCDSRTVIPTIRPARAEDDAALRKLDLVTWSPAVTPSPRSLPDAAFFRAGTRLEDVLVAVVDKEVVGYIKVGAALELESSNHVVEVQGLAVDPAMVRRGLGRALVAAAVATASASGARKLTLRVLGTNAGARALYESLGFKVEGVLKEEFWLGGCYVDDVLMALVLPR